MSLFKKTFLSTAFILLSFPQNALANTAFILEFDKAIDIGSISHEKYQIFAPRWVDESPCLWEVIYSVSGINQARNFDSNKIYTVFRFRFFTSEGEEFYPLYLNFNGGPASIYNGYPHTDPPWSFSRPGCPPPPDDDDDDDDNECPDLNITVRALPARRVRVRADEDWCQSN
ncbi:MULTISPECIES: hypothetical protein [unclassified Coleofasciculus]|uniref:hypothetical protein n=1 Tax=unclassified Coleofasciculus TaxID=2692782 RepID=UPI00187FB1BA|nr:MULTISPECIES: hypothetical protein [unclassified Coleofasciculus]MBE9124902.1 hypothetical protein [Coleofasciculus sp. LEGE 07081]MBE9147853.1 hypothetical protein [Coleofasciculus sp. LEGE 07092]